MVGEIVTHVRFGRGIVTAFAAPRIEITFDDDDSVRTFAYPLSAKRFLRFERIEAQRQAERDCEQAEVVAREREQAILEEKRRSKYKIDSETEQPDGSIIMKIRKQNLSTPVGEYFD